LRKLNLKQLTEKSLAINVKTVDLRINPS